MINMIYTDDSNAFDSIIYGEAHPANLNYFKQQTQNISNSIVESGKNFFSNLAELGEKFNGSEAMRLARVAIRSAKSIFKANVVSSILDIEGMQQAVPVMQRWIMANPTVRQVYHEQRCDGFADTYVDYHPGKIADDHYDYRRVMDGLLQIDEKTQEGVVKLYCDDLYEGDKDLSFSEKIDILDTWDIVEMFMRAGEKDPTSVNNCKL